MKFRWVVFILLALCFFIRLVFALHVPGHEFFYPDGYDYSRVAVGIVQGKGFYPPDMKPEHLYRAPLYCYLLAGMYHLFGTENLAAVRVFQCVAAVLTGWLLCAICRLWGGGLAGVIALLIYTFHPFFIYHCAGISPESFYLFLTVCTYYFLFKLFQNKKLSTAVLAGIALGLAALTKGTILLILPAALITLGFCMRQNWGRAWCAGMIIVCVTFLMISPLVGWVYNRWHEKTLLLDGSGINFWIGNSEEGYRFFKANTSKEFDAAQRHIYADVLPALDAQIENLGPKHRDAFFMKLGWNYVKQYPDRSLWMAFQRLKIFWKPWVHPLAYKSRDVIVSALATIPLFLFGFWGLAIRLQQKKPDAIFFFLSLIFMTIVLGFLFNTEIRYRIPLVDSFLIVYAAFPLAEFVGRFGFSEDSMREIACSQ